MRGLLPASGLELSLPDEEKAAFFDHVAGHPIVAPLVLLGDDLELSLERAAERLQRVGVGRDLAFAWKLLGKVEALGAWAELVEVVDGDLALEGHAGGRLAGAEVDVEVAAEVGAQGLDVDPEGALEAALDGGLFEEGRAVGGDEEGALGFFLLRLSDFDECCWRRRTRRRRS